MSKSQISQIVRNYFGSAKYKAEIYECGKISIIDINYTDFKPEHQVHTELEELIPFSKVNIESRTYSDNAISSAILSVINDDIEVTISEDNTKRTLPLLVYIEELLFNKSLI